MSSASIPRRRPTSNTCSRSAGASSGALPTARITTLSSIQSIPARALEYLDPITNEKLHSLCASSRPSAWSASCFAFLCDAYDEEELERKRATSAPCCTCIRRSRRTRLPSCRSQKKAGRSGRSAVREAVQAFHVSITMKPARSANVIAVRTKSARPIASRVDFDTESTGNVTVRDRDTMQQETVAIADLEELAARKD